MFIFRAQTKLSIRGASLRWLASRVVWVLALILVGAICPQTQSAADGATLPTQHFASAPGGLRFAIADLDGDVHPDVATVETFGGNGFGRANYSIHLRLSASGQSSFQLIGPAGGLIIEARDINGDNAVDLVLATAWRRRPVAVYLNDGHGVFSRAEIDQFLQSLERPSRNWLSQENDAPAALAVQGRHDRCFDRLVCSRCADPFVLQSLPQIGEHLISAFVFSPSGRSPPRYSSQR